jgi:hypothetical protein
MRRLTSSLGTRLRWHPLSVGVRLVTHALRAGLWRTFCPTGRRRIVEQQVLAWTTRLPHRADSAEIVGYLRQHGVRVHEGGNAFYLPPQPGLGDVLGDVVIRYPPGSGFKVLRDFRGLDEAHYLHPQRQTRLRRRLIGTPRDQLIAANYLHRLGLGPRVWDVCLLRAGRVPMPAFVVEHVNGTAPDAEECSAFLHRLRTAVTETELRISVPNWQRNKDFRCPGCNHNLLRDASGALKYIDFQNFTVRNARRLVRGSADIGRSSLVRRTRRTDAVGPFQMILHVLRERGVEVQDRLVLDLACNSGVMLHQALAAGAWWALGWDRAATARHAQDVAVARGFTRLDVMSAERQDEILGSIPGWLAPHLHESIVLCLGPRRHDTALAALLDRPWRAFVYEVHDDITDPPRTLDGPSPYTVSRVYVPNATAPSRALQVLIREASVTPAAQAASP